MSVDIIQPFSSPPLKSARETMSCAPAGISKCGEVFVTGIGDMWTFFCAYCEKATSDIGNFICHIRLDHLNASQRQLQGQSHSSIETEMNVSTISSSTQGYPNSTRPMPAIQIAGDFPTKEIPIINSQQHSPIQSEIFKEETIFSNQDNLQTISKISTIIDLNQPEYNGTGSLNVNKVCKAETNLESLALTTLNQKMQLQSATKNENDIKIVYTQEESMTCNETDIDSDMDSIYNSRNEEPETNMMMISPECQYLFPYKCKICNLGFKTKQGKNFHTMRLHRCDVCNKVLKTPRGLRKHKMSHVRKSHYVCPVCPDKFFKQSLFVTHILTHESSTCFPCQVCGKIYKTNSGRKKHWESHAKERPFACDICYRRYPNQHYLTQHQRSHNKYQYNFCPTEFNSDYTQLPPNKEYEKLPDIKENIERQRTLSHEFESDED